MDADLFKDIIVPVIGGLGLFMLGLEFMERGIQALSADKMRDLLSKMAGSPGKGVVAGTVITGIIQSSTAMTVMTVGLVNAGVLSLRGAIGVIMGANIGTTLGNGLIALPLGPIGLLFGGLFALVYVFARSPKVQNIALACMGFSLIFYGLNLLTGGLKPLRELPAFMNVISSLTAENIFGVIACALIAALITACIHSSSATIGIVMGLGASGILEWQVAIAFAIGADLGTTITSWIASLNLSKNAKRTAYAHIGFNLVGVSVVLILFFPAVALLEWVMSLTVGNPGSPVMVDGQATYPLVPVAVGAFSIFFNIFNVLIMFPFVNVFEKLLLRIGHTDAEDLEDYSIPEHLDDDAAEDISRALPLMQAEAVRLMAAAREALAVARREEGARPDPDELLSATDQLGRAIRSYAAEAMQADATRDQLNQAAHVVEEVDYLGSLHESLHQVARRVTRDEFSEPGAAALDTGLDRLAISIEALAESSSVESAELAAAAEDAPVTGFVDVTEAADDDAQAPAADVGPAESFDDLRWCVIDAEDIPGREKPALLSLVGSMERSEELAQRIRGLRETISRDLQVSESERSAAEDPAGV